MVAAQVGFFGFLFALIVFYTVGGVALTYLTGRMAFKAGRRLLGWARGQKLLPGERQAPMQPAQDVTVGPPEPLDDQPAPAQRTTAQPVADAPRRSYTRLDVETGTTAAQVAEVMRRYLSDPVLGLRAQNVIDTLDSANLKRQSLFAELEGTFQRGTMSWDKFAAPSYAALDSILRNSCLLGNRIQSFDTKSYLRLQRTVEQERAARGVVDGTINAARGERWRIFQEMIASLDAVQETNEGLLLELDKLAAELGVLSGSDTSERSDRIIEEIRRLVEEAKYYR